LVAERVVNIAQHGEVEAVDGTVIDVPADSVCIHGDAPNSVEVLDRIHERLTEEEIELAPLADLV